MRGRPVGANHHSPVQGGNSHLPQDGGGCDEEAPAAVDSLVRV